MQVNGSTQVFMILGDPIAEVRAPELFNPLFQRHGVDAVLVSAHVAPADLAGFVRHTLRARNIDGLWLTIPHKAALFAMLDHCDPLGTVAQAVNAARRNEDGSLEGALFDGSGFVKALDGLGVQPQGARALVVGAGGVGVAISVSLAARGVAWRRWRSATWTPRAASAWRRGSRGPHGRRTEPADAQVQCALCKEYKYIADHNGIKGYTGVYLMKAAIEKAGQVDRKAVAQALHTLDVKVAQQPGVIMGVTMDANGDLDRESFIVEVKGGKQEVKEVLPALGKK